MKSDEINVPSNVLESFQEIADLLAELVGIPAALIMRVSDPKIEVLVASQSEGNRYTPGDAEVLCDSGLYCETVINSQRKLLVPDALADPHWDHNPDIKLNMISYLGFPINLPNGKPFGTLCVLDNKANAFSETIERLMHKFQLLIESHLALVFMNQALGDEDKRVIDYLSEVKTLRGFVPICSHCKSIKNEKDEWHPIEHYLGQENEAKLSHGICPACIKDLYPEIQSEL